MTASNQDTQTTQQSQTAPGALGMPTINGILGQLNPLISSSGLNPTESGAISQLTSNAQGGNPFAPAITANANSLLAGGGAQTQAPAVQQNLANYTSQVSPMASNMNYDPTQAPGMQALLQTIQGDTTNQVNGQFAAAGRDMSGMNTQTLARGLAQGEAAPLLAQYNQNIQNQQGAASNLFNAGNTTAGALAGMQTQANANQQQGATAAGGALNAQNYGPNTVLAAQQMGQQLPAQNLGLLAQIGIPIAGMSTTSSGSGTSNTQSTPSLLSSIGQGVNIGTQLFGGGSTGTAGPTSVGGAPLSSAGQSNVGLLSSLFNFKGS